MLWLGDVEFEDRGMVIGDLQLEVADPGHREINPDERTAERTLILKLQCH